MCLPGVISGCFGSLSAPHRSHSFIPGWACPDLDPDLNRERPYAARNKVTDLRRVREQTHASGVCHVIETSTSSPCGVQRRQPDDD